MKQFKSNDMLGSPLKEIDLKICNNLGLNYDKYVTFTISKKFEVRNDNLDYLRLRTARCLL